MTITPLANCTPISDPEAFFKQFPIPGFKRPQNDDFNSALIRSIPKDTAISNLIAQDTKVSAIPYFTTLSKDLVGYLFSFLENPQDFVHLTQVSKALYLFPKQYPPVWNEFVKKHLYIKPSIRSNWSSLQQVKIILPIVYARKQQSEKKKNEYICLREELKKKKAELEPKLTFSSIQQELNAENSRNTKLSNIADSTTIVYLNRQQLMWRYQFELSIVELDLALLNAAQSNLRSVYNNSENVEKLLNTLTF
jgi:uncharacterized protein YihD (DUF1040 family)